LIESGAAYIFTRLEEGPRLTIELDSAGGYFIEFDLAPGATCHLQYALSVTGPWNTLAILTAPASGHIEFADFAPATGDVFFRTVQP